MPLTLSKNASRYPVPVSRIAARRCWTNPRSKPPPSPQLLRPLQPPSSHSYRGHAMTAEELETLGAILGHRFARPEYLEQALTHRSRRQHDPSSDNERLEFLGDRVLGLVVSEMLSHSFPDWDAG